ncbi:MAG: SPOR domain-containing protein [Acetobacter sp.]|nr:SPOR domain-containing protein [Acetobacter sp.]
MRDDNEHTEDHVDHTREPMSMDYEDDYDYDFSEKKGLFGSLLGESGNTRHLAIGAFLLGGLLIVGVGGWALFGHHQKTVPVIGPPAVPARTKPTNPGGLQLNIPNMADTTEKSKAQLAQAPEKPDLAALTAHYGSEAQHQQNQQVASSTPVVGTKQESKGENKLENTAQPVQPVLPPVSQQASEDAKTVEQLPQSKTPQLEQSVVHEPVHENVASSSASVVSSVKKETAQAAVEQHHTLAKVETHHAKEHHHASKHAEICSSAPVSASKTGHYIVQLAALQSPQDVDREWKHLQTHYPSLFAGKSYKIVRVIFTNATFYRLQVPGFATLEEAHTFCHQVRNRGLACIIAR